MRSRFLFAPLFALGVAVSLLAPAGRAQAHAHLVSSTPAADAAVPTPKTIELHFSEKLEPKFSGLEVADANGGKVAAKSEVPPNDARSLRGTFAGQLSPGGYRVKWRAVATDGHRTEGAFNFSVR
jgi:methionine-rich copper-binding protein CopC